MTTNPVTRLRAPYGFMVIILLFSIHNFGVLLGKESLYSWSLIAMQLFMVAIVSLLIGRMYAPSKSLVTMFVVAVFALYQLLATSISVVNIYYIYMIFASPFVMFVLIHAASNRDIVIVFGALSNILAVIYLVPSVMSTEYLGFSGMLPSSSMFGMLASVFTYVAFVKFYYDKTHLNLASLMVWVVILIETKHRTGLLAFALASASFLILAYRAKVSIKILISIAGALVFSVFIFVVLSYTNSEIVNKMFHGGVVRLENLNFSGRIYIWTSLLHGYFSGSVADQLFGSGIGSSSTYLVTFHGDTIGDIAVAHNEFIRLLFEYGLFGLLLYLFVIYKIFDLHSPYIAPLPIAAHYFSEMFFSNVFFSGPFYLLVLIMAVRYIRYLVDENREYIVYQ